MKKLLTFADVQKELNLEILYAPCSLEEIFIQDKKIGRIGMQLMGYFPVHHPERCHLMGLQEASYIASIDIDSRRKALHNFFAAGTTGLIIAQEAHCDEAILEAARKFGTVVAHTNMSASEFIHDFYYFTAKHFAPIQVVHGVLVEVHGEGVLITGDSGIGKSETAIELVKRGHRLIADDAVEIKRMPDKKLIGTSLGVAKGFTEMRGIGIVDVGMLFGIQAIMSKIKITSAVHFVPWQDDAVYERLGLDEETIDILGIKVPLSTIPVRDGRNLAVVIEVNAINLRSKRHGFNAAAELNARLLRGE